jgi:biopolymer transport protein ExbD
LARTLDWEDQMVPEVCHAWSGQDPQIRRPLRCRIDVAAFASVMIALLAMFMAHAAETVHSARPVALAHAAHSIGMPSALREDAMVVRIARDGKIFFNTVQVDPKDLTAEIQDGLKRGAERTVYIKADARARYRVVADVIDSVQRAGLYRVGLITQP